MVLGSCGSRYFCPEAVSIETGDDILNHLEGLRFREGSGG